MGDQEYLTSEQGVPGHFPMVEIKKIICSYQCLFSDRDHPLRFRDGVPEQEVAGRDPWEAPRGQCARQEEGAQSAGFVFVFLFVRKAVSKALGRCPEHWSSWILCVSMED